MKEKFYIGEVEKKFNIGKKTLRYYDQIELLSPSKNEDTGYRFYSAEDLAAVQKIKYLKETGFELKEIKNLISTSDLDEVDGSFSSQIEKIEEAELELQCRKEALKDWKSLLSEAKLALKYGLDHINIKYLEMERCIFLDQEYKENYRELTINREFNNYIESINNKITGPVMVEYPSLEEKIEDRCRSNRIIQRYLLECSEEKTVEFGGALFASCYHLGSYEDIKSTYEKVKKWLDENSYKYEEKFYERHILDYWTTKNEDCFVTEILVKLLD